jgi:hypothetical protein
MKNLTVAIFAGMSGPHLGAVLFIPANTTNISDYIGLSLYLLFLTSLVFATRLGTIITIAFPVEVKVFGRETIGPSWRNLPVARNSIEFRAENDRENTIFLNSEGRLIFHDKIITPNQLRTELQASYSSIYKQRLLFVVDATTRMEKVYEILTVCRQSGIRNIIHIVRPFDP